MRTNNFSILLMYNGQRTCYTLGVINFFVEYIPKTLRAGFVALDHTNIFCSTTLSKNASPSCFRPRYIRVFLALNPHFSEKCSKKSWTPLIKIGSIRILFDLFCSNLQYLSHFRSFFGDLIVISFYYDWNLEKRPSKLTNFCRILDKYVYFIVKKLL